MAEEYTYVEYPKMLYHPNGSLRVVQNAEEETAAKADGYVNSPAEYGIETCPTQPPEQPGGFPQDPQGFRATSAPPPTPQSAPQEAQSEVAALESEAASRRRH